MHLVNKIIRIAYRAISPTQGCSSFYSVVSIINNEQLRKLVDIILYSLYVIIYYTITKYRLEQQAKLHWFRTKLKLNAWCLL